MENEKKVRRVIKKTEFCQFNPNRLIHENSLTGRNHGFDLDIKQLEFFKAMEGDVYAFVEEQDMKCELLALYAPLENELLIESQGIKKEWIKREFTKCLFDLVKRFIPEQLEK